MKLFLFLSLSLCIAFAAKQKDQAFQLMIADVKLALQKDGFILLLNISPSADFLEKQIKKLTDKKIKCGLKKVTFTHLEHIRLTGDKNDETIILCYLQALKDSNLAISHGYFWSVLGSLYKLQGAMTQASTCFKQAQKASGKVQQFIKEWQFIGPFVIGKMELDGDPLEAYGGIQNVSKYRYGKSESFHSELVSGGEVKWTAIKQNSAQNMVQVKPAVNWNDLVSSLGSLGITEWQGWVVGELAINEKNQNVIVQCLGVHTIYIDDLPLTGDVYHRESYWYGMNLEPGIHTFYIRLRSKVVANFKCSFQSVKQDFEVLSPHYLPDIVDGYLLSGYFSLPVANYHPTNFLKIVTVTLKDIIPEIDDLEIQTVNRNEQVAPGQIYLLPIKLTSSSSRVIPGCTNRDTPGDVSLDIRITTSSGVKTMNIVLRCRRYRQSFLFTFIDHDGSVQHAAAIPPLQDCPGGLCPTLLTLHGTTISPQNQADSYKEMVDGVFQFGSQYAWLLAPTRHGAHNWEGPGLLTALTALERLGEMTVSADWVLNKADTQRLVFAGHSMGGHGAWHIASHYPDRCIALMSLASWIKKEEYGDSNLFFRHDISTSHTEPAIKAVMEACIAENDADRHVVNLQGIPIIARIGAEDRTVHPYFVRRMYRLLKEDRVAVNYSEVTGKEHWWWDTSITNDGGVVNDKTLRDFTNHHVTEHLFSSGTCSDEDCNETSRGHEYTAGSRRNFTVVSYNPALGASISGVTILQQIIPYRQSIIKGFVQEDLVILTAVNVRRFTVREPYNRKMNWLQKKLQVDDTVFSVADIKLVVTSNQSHFCKDKGIWKICFEDIYALGMRGPFNLGPARRVVENPFIIIIGTKCSEMVQQYILQAAVYIANLFFLTSDTSALVVRDTEIEEQEIAGKNAILLGNPEENLHTDRYMSKIPVKIKGSTVHLDGCVFKHNRIGVLSLAPNGNSGLVLVLMGNSKEGFLDVVALATPTIPPMTRSPFSNLIPDYVITGPEFGRKGPGGYLCAGFWGNSWEFRSDISSCVCDL